MDTFNKIRSGIGELKKEKEDLKTRYQFLSGELGRIVETNTKEIRLLHQQISAQAQALAAADARIRKMEEGMKGSEARLSTQISSLGKQSGDYREALTEAGQRIQRAQSTAEGATKGVAQDREYEKSITKHIDTLQKRVGDLESLRERVAEVSKNADVLFKGVGDLEKLRSEVASVQEKTSALDATITGKADLLESKLSPDISALRNGLKSGSQTVVKLQSAMEKVALELQAIKKDMVSERESIGRVREGTTENRRRLELVGTLQTKIKNLEDLKSELVKGVESLKSLTNTMAALEQRTRDVDARLTSADKALEAKVLEKGGLLEKMFSEKTRAMESQMQERLKFLEANLTERGRTMETRIVEGGKQMEMKVSTQLSEMEKGITVHVSGMQKMKKEVQAAKSGMRSLENSSATLQAGMAEMKKSLALNSAALTKMDAGLGRKMALDLQSMKKDMTATSEKLAMLTSEIAGTKTKVLVLDKAQTRLRDVEKLQKSLAAELKEAKAMQKDITELGHAIDSVRTELGNREAVLETKLDNAATSIRKDTGFNSASISRIDSEVKKSSLEMQSLRKDLQAGLREIARAQGDAAQTHKKLGEIEKLQIRLTEIENSKDAMSAAMESQLEDKIKFLDTTLRQKADNIEIALEEKTRGVLSKLDSTIAAVKKEISANAKATEAVKGRLDALARFDERLGSMEQDKEEIAKSLSSLHGLRAALSENSEKVRNVDRQLAEMKSGLSRDMAEIRGQIDAAKTEKRDKFDSAVKAFLTSRADISNGMTALNIKLSEMEKRVDAFSRMATRIDLIEKKMDRLTEKSTEIRRDVDHLERKGGGEEKVLFVDLDRESEGV